MPRTCRASGCFEHTASRFASYCPRHRSRQRRHGAPDQRAVTKSDLTPFLAIVTARIERNLDSPLWDTLEGRWSALVDHASRLAEGCGQRVVIRHERRAAAEITKLGTDVEPRAVVVTALALIVMWMVDPHRFRSDQGFRAQLVRRVRGLTETNAGTWFDHREGRLRRAYRDLPPRAAAVIAEWLIAIFGAAGAHLGSLELADRKKEAEQRDELKEALTLLV